MLRLHYTADPDMTVGRIAALRRKYTTEAYWQREMEIEASALSGQKVYPEFDPAMHVIGHDKIPPFGCCYMAIDPHPRTPHAHLWVMIDPWNDWYVYRELWPSKMYGLPGRIRDDEQEPDFTTREYAETIAALEGNSLKWVKAETDDEYAEYVQSKAPMSEYIVDRWMDQAGKGFKVSDEGKREETYATRYRKFGIECRDPIKAHQTGEDAIRLLLRNRKHDIKGNWPRLHISDQCRELILELQNHRYKITRTPSDERDLKQDRSEFRCHMVDLLRYLATSDATYLKNYQCRRHTGRLAA